jgi:hypothetical protein
MCKNGVEVGYPVKMLQPPSKLQLCTSIDESRLNACKLSSKLDLEGMARTVNVKQN